VLRSYRVASAPVCQSAAVSDDGTTVLSVPISASQSAKSKITGLHQNDAVTVKWAMGWTGVTNSIGGRPMIVQNGRPVSITCSPGNPLCQANPRTAIAEDPKGIILLVVADGRAPGWSSSISLTAFQDFLTKQLGAVSALNLDGGGSSTMWVARTGPWCAPTSTSTTGCLVNHANPQNHYIERPVENALTVFKGSDPDEPKLAGP
jgi:hypothetical protein